MSIWSLTYKRCIFQRYHSDKHLSKFLLTSSLCLNAMPRLVLSICLTYRFMVIVSALLSLVGPVHQLLLPLAAFKYDVFWANRPKISYDLTWRWRQKTGIDMEQNYISVTVCIRQAVPVCISTSGARCVPWTHTSLHHIDPRSVQSF